MDTAPLIFGGFLAVMSAIISYGMMSEGYVWISMIPLIGGLGTAVYMICAGLEQKPASKRSKGK